jgi:MFS family permease
VGPRGVCLCALWTTFVSSFFLGGAAAMPREAKAPPLREDPPPSLCRVVPLLALGYGLCFIDRTNLSFAELKIREDPNFNLTAAGFGLSSGVFFVGYGAFQVPFVYSLEQMSAHKVLAAELIVWGALSSSLSAVQSTAQLYAQRFLLGVAEAGFYPGMLYYLSRMLPNERLGLASSAVTLLGACLGTIVGTLSAGAILSAPSLDGLLGWYSWRWLFLIQGTPAILCGALLYLLLPEAASRRKRATAVLESAVDFCSEEENCAHPPPSPPLPPLPPLPPTPGQVQSVSSPFASPPPHRAHESTPTTLFAPPPPSLPLCVSLSRVLTRPLTWIFALQHFAYCNLAYISIFFLPLMLSEAFPSWPPWHVSLIVAVPLSLSIVAGIVAGCVTDRGATPYLRRRRRVLTVGCCTLITAAS